MTDPKSNNMAVDEKLPRATDPTSELEHGHSSSPGSLKDQKEWPVDPEAEPVPPLNPRAISHHTTHTTTSKNFNSGRAAFTETYLTQQDGITRIEAFNRVFKRWSPVACILYSSLALTSMAYIFDSSSTSNYLTFATSFFDASEYMGTISTVQSVMVAVSKPFLAKIADTFSRQTAYIVTLLFYVVGYIIVAASPNGGALCVGRVICAAGQAGLNLITRIIIADLTPLEWRGVSTALTDFCYLFLPYVSGTMVGHLCPASKTNNGSDCWRWGFGMFCIITPVLVTPVILTLTYADWKAKQMGELGAGASKLDMDQAQAQGTLRTKHMGLKDRLRQFYHLLVLIDAIGLLLLGFAFSLIFLPFSLNGQANGGWSNASMIAMLVCGFVILLMFIGWEMWLAPEPMTGPRIIKNRTFLLAATLDVFYFCSGFVRSGYWSSWIYVIKPWSNQNWSYFTQTDTVCLTLFGILAGLVQRYTHRYKFLQIFGLCVRVLAMGITYWAVGDNANTTALVFTQILNSLGGACSVVGTRVASQASVPHQDLAMVTANLTLWTKLGGAVGSAISSAIYTGRYPKELAKKDISPELAKKAYASYTKAHAIPWGSPERKMVMEAFDQTMRIKFILALVLSFIPLGCGLFMPNFYLGKTQNAVDGTGNDGRVIGEGQVDENGKLVTGKGENPAKLPFYKRLWNGIIN